MDKWIILLLNAMPTEDITYHTTIYEDKEKRNYLAKNLIQVFRNLH
jgi:hypothetical protein